MEKLQDLLKSFWIETQWDKKLYKVVYWEKWFEFWYLPYVWAKLEKTWRLQDEILFSKSFWFIKWLVENDKIERLAFSQSWLLGKYTDFELSYDTPREDYTNMLLMELSIQDNPIEYLISVLR